MGTLGEWTVVTTVGVMTQDPDSTLSSPTYPVLGV